MLGALDAIRGKKTTIEYKKEDLNKYNTIYIGTPVWASKPTPAITEFIEQNNFKNKNIITFATMEGNGDKKTIEILNKKIKQKGGNITGSFSIKTKDTDIDQLTKQAIQNINQK